MNEKTITVTCAGSRSIPRQELETFQGNLVELREENFQKLKKLLVKFGFRFPVSVWNNKIIDGHQRLFVLKRLIEDEGYSFPYDVPVCDIEAKDEKEAKELVLIARSEYGETSDQGLYEFLETNDLKFEEIKFEIELPGLNLDSFEACYYRELNPGDPGAWTGMPEFNQQDKTAYHSIHIHFKDENAMNEFARAIGREISKTTHYLWFPEIEKEATVNKYYE